MNLKIEVLPHPPYFPDISLTDHLYRALDKFPKDGRFRQLDVKNAFKEFVQYREEFLFQVHTHTCI